MYEDRGLGLIPSNPDTFNIVADKPYTWIVSTIQGDNALKEKVNTLDAYATITSAKKTGIFEGEVVLTPKYVMPYSAWANLFSNLGITVKDVTVGGPSVAPPAFDPVKNISTFWTPKLKAAGDFIGSGFGYVKTIAIAGAIIAGSIAVIRFFPKRQYKENPRRIYRR